ncbi:hypothetical protein B0I35DRAFT_279813 [Stachybotrys elegans]|uniref:Uncharacterized protein n=1 Tax=Stachybotrys elegans TaxID=80388 RepID=A0A8K0WQM5_9HYPO|nr:hypothetical protein B0I35DRAFT_279813 [Stachybotrys elegans]
MAAGQALLPKDAIGEKQRPFTWSSSEAGFLKRPLNGLESFFVMLMNNANPVNDFRRSTTRLPLVSGQQRSDAVPVTQRRLAGRLPLPPRPWWLPQPEGYGGCPGRRPSHRCCCCCCCCRARLARLKSGCHAPSPRTISYLFSVLRNTKVPTCHWVPATQEVHIDGIGMLILADRFVSALASVVRAAVNADPELHHHHHHHRPADTRDGLAASLSLLAPSLGQEPVHSHAVQRSRRWGFLSIALPTTPGSGVCARRQRPGNL